MPVALPAATMAVIFHQLFDLDLTPKEIASHHGVSERAVRKWRLNWGLFGAPLPPKGGIRVGRERACTMEQELALIEWLNTKPTAYLDEMAWFLFDCYGVRPPRSSVWRILHRHNQVDCSAMASHRRVCYTVFFWKDSRTPTSSQYGLLLLPAMLPCNVSRGINALSTCS
jgi:hypothetical protein